MPAGASQGAPSRRPAVAASSLRRSAAPSASGPAVDGGRRPARRAGHGAPARRDREPRPLARVRHRRHRGLKGPCRWRSVPTTKATRTSTRKMHRAPNRTTGVNITPSPSHSGTVSPVAPRGPGGRHVGRASSPPAIRLQSGPASWREAAAQGPNGAAERRERRIGSEGHPAMTAPVLGRPDGQQPTVAHGRHRAPTSRDDDRRGHRRDLQRLTPTGPGRVPGACGCRWRRMATRSPPSRPARSRRASPPSTGPSPRPGPTRASYAAMRSSSKTRSGWPLSRSARFSSSTRAWYASHAPRAASTASRTALSSMAAIGSTAPLPGIALGSGRRCHVLPGASPRGGDRGFARRLSLRGGCGTGLSRLPRLGIAREPGGVRVPVALAHPAQAVLLAGLAGEVVARRLVRLDPEARRSDCSGAGWGWWSRRSWSALLYVPDADLASRRTSITRRPRRCKARTE